LTLKCSITKHYVFQNFQCLICGYHHSSNWPSFMKPRWSNIFDNLAAHLPLFLGIKKWQNSSIWRERVLKLLYLKWVHRFWQFIASQTKYHNALTSAPIYFPLLPLVTSTISQSMQNTSDLTDVQCLWSDGSIFTPIQNVRCLHIQFKICVNECDWNCMECLQYCAGVITDERNFEYH
jgi:hypothetical protein